MGTLHTSALNNHDVLVQNICCCCEISYV